MGVFDRFSLQGRVAIITGASSGLGAGFALTLAEAGADVAVGARRADRFGEATDCTKNVGGHAVAVTTDVTHPADCEALAYFESEMTSQVPAEKLMRFVKQTPTLGRLGAHNELDTAVVSLASSASSYITRPLSSLTAECPDTN